MSQTRIPVNGGLVNPETTPTSVLPVPRVISQQYAKAKGLEPGKTEWNPDGRPIYNRLPSFSQTYRIDFEGGRKGYIYLPPGQSDTGSISCEVLASDNLEEVFIKGGTIVWEKGRNTVLPALVNLREISAGPSRYLLAYQLIYDESDYQALYRVSDYNIGGQEINITSSTDAIFGWRYTAENAFVGDSYWSNRDTLFPSYVQPGSCWLAWSGLPSALSEIKVRCPKDKVATGTCTLSYQLLNGWTDVLTTEAQVDSEGYYYLFEIPTPSFQTGWRLTFSEPSAQVSLVSVSGEISLVSKRANPSPRAKLVMYPENRVPAEVSSQISLQVPYAPEDLIFAGQLNAFTGLIESLTPQGAILGFQVGQRLQPATNYEKVYFSVSMPGPVAPNDTLSNLPPDLYPELGYWFYGYSYGDSSQFSEIGDWWVSNGESWNYVPTRKQNPPLTPVSYCKLAFVEVSNNFKVIDIIDLRETTIRDYQPVADWLTLFWDENLINLYNQVAQFDKTWLGPQTALKQEYLKLPDYGIVLSESSSIGS